LTSPAEETEAPAPAVSGYSVSSAGDVNGDGLDDLIVGAHQADLTNSADAGKSYVVFGKANTDAINLRPLLSPAFSPLITKPPVPDVMFDKLTVVVSALPNTTKDLPMSALPAESA
jgi:hypothetical protein